MSYSCDRLTGLLQGGVQTLESVNVTMLVQEIADSMFFCQCAALFNSTHGLFRIAKLLRITIVVPDENCLCLESERNFVSLVASVPENPGRTLQPQAQGLQKRVSDVLEELS